MNNLAQSRQPDIVQEFVQESHHIIDCLEPALIKLGEGRQPGDCWRILDCSITDCHRHGKSHDFPCWLHLGHIGMGLRTCPRADSELVCRSCKVFWVINGDARTINAAFRLFHAMKGCAEFLHLQRISDVSSSAETLLDLIMTGKIKMEPQHIDLIARACDFSRLALSIVGEKYSDEAMAAPAAELAYKLTRSSNEALAKVQSFHARLRQVENRVNLFSV